MTPGQSSTNEDMGELQEMLSAPLNKVAPVCHLPKFTISKIFLLIIREFEDFLFTFP